MAFSRTWNAAYEAQPADVENISLGAGRIRNLKSDIQERLEVDHFHAGDAQDGEHKKLTFGAPIVTPANIANKGFLYGKDVGGKIELHWEDEDGNEIQITDAGQLVGITIVGEIRLWATASAPSGWVLCNGTAYDSVGDTTFAALYAVIANIYGGSDGTDFEVPDLQGRTPIGVGTGDASDATAHALADKEGAETHTLITSETPTHAHNLRSAGGSARLLIAGAGTANLVSGNHDIEDQSATQSTGGGNAHNNLQPSLTLNYIIKK
ncbi:hypothetical protein LCGC14_2570560 [marine sediment metagenome]|uniref:Phage tail collar domain-containing protein n=1 Tax=marine sediment metagenome TaxID=412755 RepID=A0A0F9B578_9ZZZZ